MNKYASLLTVAVTAAFASSANAALSARDLNSGGDALLTFDSNSGLEWLDVSYNVGRNSVSILSDTILASQSFRYATGTEVLALWHASGASGPFVYDPAVESYAGNFLGAQLLINLLGCTSDVLGQPCDGVDQNWHFGRYASAASSSGFNLGLVDYFGPPDYRAGTGAMLIDIGTIYPTFFDRPDIGNYLVRSAVAEPGTNIMIIAGALAFGIMRRRFRRHEAQVEK